MHQVFFYTIIWRCTVKKNLKQNILKLPSKTTVYKYQHFIVATRFGLRTSSGQHLGVWGTNIFYFYNFKLFFIYTVSNMASHSTWYALSTSYLWLRELRVSNTTEIFCHNKTLIFINCCVLKASLKHFVLLLDNISIATLFKLISF
jgi:hypothetical protein